MTTEKYGVEYTSPATGERVTEWYATAAEQDACHYFKERQGQRPAKVERRSDDRLKADYAELGVTTGYVGNVYCGPERDDRSFRVFTQVLERRQVVLRGEVIRESWDPASVTVFEAPRNAGIYRGPVDYDTPAVRARLDELRQLVDAGQARVRAA